jgi:methionyl-tRNA formyltransferase
MTRAVFMGSPEMAVPSLEALAAYPGVRVVGVLSQPDRPAGRRRRLQPCPVRQAARRLGLATGTPEKAGSAEGLALLRQWAPELVVVCAYGQLLPAPVLDLPPLGSFNLHFSLLPRWRGASPVQAALLAGDAHTGVSLQRMVMALDAGPLVASTAPLPIAPTDTAETLGGRLAVAAGDLLTRALPLLLGGAPPEREQDEAGVTFCRTIKKAQGAVDFAQEDAAAIERKVRAYTPWPGCHVYAGARRLGLAQVAVLSANETPGPVGVLQADGSVQTRQGRLQLLVVKPEGKRAMPVADFINGMPQAVGLPLTPVAA